MAKYYVHVREVWIQTKELEADSREDALQRVRDGEGEDVELEYSHTMDRDTWTVEERN